MGSRANQELATPAAAPTSVTAKSSPGRNTLTGGVEEGNGLPYRQKSLFESSLNRDLSDVRVHTDDAADNIAGQNDARALAIGNDIHFAKGEYKPGTPEGDQLLAHEVAHTQQQDGAAQPGGDLKKTTPGDRAEANADAAASAMVSGGAAEVTSEPIAIARKARNEPVAPRQPEPQPANDTGGGEGGGEGGGGQGPTAEGDVNATTPKTEQEGEIGELTAERVGVEDEEAADQPVGPEQNTEGFKEDVKDAGKDMPKEGDAAAGIPKGPGGGAGGTGEAQLSPELIENIEGAKADAKAGAEEAEGEAAAYKAEMNERRDRFDNEQIALTMENLRTMSPADKRASLIELGYDKKAVKKMKDAELDGVITGRLETEQRKSKILGMDEAELKALTPARKAQFLIDLGIDAKDIRKIGDAKAAAAFDQVIREAKIPGQHKVKIKIKGGLLGKSWEVKINVDGEGQADFDVKKKGGILSSIFKWVKMIAPIVLTMILPAAGIIALAVFQTVTAIIRGDWLGAIIGAAGGLVAVGALAGIKEGASSAAKAFQKIADVAGKVEKTAKAAQATIAAAKAKSPGGLLAAISQGASAFAGFASAKAANFKASMEKWAAKLDTWSRVVSGGEKVVKGIKSGNVGTAVGGAFDAVAAATSKRDPATGKETNATSKQFSQLSRYAGYAAAGQRAAQSDPPDYSGIVDAALGISAELKTGKKFQDSIKIASAANRLANAVVTKDPEAIMTAGLALAEAIHTTKYDADNPGALDEEGNPKLDANGKPIDQDRASLVSNYQKAANVVKFASMAIKAVSGQRPNYLTALDAATGLIAELTDSKKFDRAAILTSRLDRWTAAVRSKNELAIVEAGKAFGDAINDMRADIQADRDKAKAEAQAKLGAGEDLGVDDGGDIPPLDIGLSETVDVVGNAEFIELEPPGLITELKIDLDGDGVDDFTTTDGPTTGGANGTGTGTRPGGPTTQPKPPATTQPKPPTQQPRPTNPRPTSPTNTAPRKIELPGLSMSGKTLFEIIKSGAAILDKGMGHPGIDGFIGMFESLQGQYKKLAGDPLTTVEAIEQFGKAVDTLAVKIPALWQDIETEMKSFEKWFFDLTDEVKPNPAEVRRLTKLLKAGKRISRLANIPSGGLELYKNALLVLGYNEEGNEVTTRERLAAAAEIANSAGSYAKDLKWAIKAGELVLKKYTPVAIQSAIDIVWNAAVKYGNKFAVITLEYVRPVLQKAAEKESAQAIMTIASKVAVHLAEIGDIVATVGKSAAGSEALKGALKLVGPRLGAALRFGLSWPVAIAYEVGKLELMWAEHIYKESLEAFSTWLTPGVFGRNINDIKREVRNFPAGTDDECNRFFKYAMYDMLGSSALSRTKSNWVNYFFTQGKAHLLYGSVFARDFPVDPLKALRAIEFVELKQAAAGHIKDFAIEFLDAEYRAVFIERRYG